MARTRDRRIMRSRPGGPGALPAQIPRSRAADDANRAVCTSDSVHEPVHALPRRSPDASYRTLPPPGRSPHACARWDKATQGGPPLLTAEPLDLECRRNTCRASRRPLEIRRIRSSGGPAVAAVRKGWSWPAGPQESAATLPPTRRGTARPAGAADPATRKETTPGGRGSSASWLTVSQSAATPMGSSRRKPAAWSQSSESLDLIAHRDGMPRRRPASSCDT